MEHDEGKKLHNKQVEHLEQEVATLQYRFKKEKEQLQNEVDDKKSNAARQAAEIKELTTQKNAIKSQVEEYEQKIKTLIGDYERESKRYIKDIQEIHEHYRGVQSTAAEMESRIAMYKQDWEKATQAERATKKENLRLTFQIDELTERHRYMERKYLQLVQRVGASQEDLEAVEVLMASGQDQINPKNLKNGPPVVSSIAKDRIPSRLDKVRGDHHGYLYGDNEEANYRHRDQQSSHERKASGQR